MPEPINQPPAPLPPAATTAPSVPPPSPEPQTPPASPSIPSKLSFLKQLKFPRLHFKLPPRLLALLPKLVVLVLFIVVIIVVLPYLLKLNLFQSVVAPTPAPSAAPLSTPTTELPSPYADDQEVLDFEQALSALESKLKIVNFREDTLHLPNLDWDVSFK